MEEILNKPKSIFPSLLASPTAHKSQKYFWKCCSKRLRKTFNRAFFAASSFETIDSIAASKSVQLTSPSLLVSMMRVENARKRRHKNLTESFGEELLQFLHGWLRDIVAWHDETNLQGRKWTNSIQSSRDISLSLSFTGKINWSLNRSHPNDLSFLLLPYLIFIQIRIFSGTKNIRIIREKEKCTVFSVCLERYIFLYREIYMYR